MLFVAALGVTARGADVLTQIRDQMREILLRQPDYTCTETIERSRQVTGSRSRIEDTLRLEVALVNGKEMFAWPGSKQFEDHEMDDLVATGMFGNGNFALYARTLFLETVAVIEDRGTTQLGGSPALRYDFRVARATGSHWLRVNKLQATTGFHGSFYADPVTLDVRRMEIVAEDIPAELGVIAAESTVDYGRIRIGDERYLLPLEGSQMMAVPDEVSRNWIRFADCRKYTGESTLRFDDPVLTEAAAPAEQVADVAIPAGLSLQLQIAALDLKQAAVGDSVRATLKETLKNRHELLAPKGSIASGRIVLLDRYSDHFALKIEFQDLDWPGGHAHVKLSFDHTAFADRSITMARTGSEILITRQAGPRLSGILMFWRSE